MQSAQPNPPSVPAAAAATTSVATVATTPVATTTAATAATAVATTATATAASTTTSKVAQIPADEVEGDNEWLGASGGEGDWSVEPADAVEVHENRTRSSSGSHDDAPADDAQLEARRIEVQTTNMEEAYNLANSMQAMTYDHRSYAAHFRALCQDLLEAKEGFSRKRGVERAQLMTEAQSGMLTIRAMFEDIRGHKVIPTSEEDPLSATLFFEDRVLKSIKFFAREIQVYASTLIPTDRMQWDAKPAASSVAATTTATGSSSASSDASILSAVRFAPTVSVVGTQNAPPASPAAVITAGMSDEEIARIYQAEEDAAYARLLHQQRAARSGTYRPPHMRGAGTVSASVPLPPLPSNSAASTAVTAAPTATAAPAGAPIADQEMQAFLDSQSEYPSSTTD